MKIFRQQCGMSIIELLVAFSIFVIGATANLFLYQQYKSITQKAKIQALGDQEISNLLNAIRMSVDFQQISFDSSATYTLEALNSANLPLAWTGEQIVDASTCPDCKNKFGYIVQPHQGIRGIYTVTIRLSKGADEYKDYEFLASTK